MVNTSAVIKMFDTILSMQTMDDECINKAKEIFENYKSLGIIHDCEFDDDRWMLSDEYSNVSFLFDINEFSYKKYYEKLLMISVKQFRDYLKAYVLFTMGDLVLKALQNLINDIKHFISCDPEKLYALSTDVYLTAPNRISEFFSILPEPAEPENMEYILDVLELMTDVNYSSAASQKRSLASFDSYFLFNDIMNDYWNSIIPDEERLFFYPLYLWWQITGVIPMRPREFILTPRNCVEQKEDGWYITLRKNQIKGSDKKIAYKIEGDYITVQYKIPDKLAGEMLKYLDFTKQYDSTELDTLFITDTHYKQWNQKKPSNSRYFTYVNLNCVMRYFYHDVIEGRYGLRIIYDREVKHLEEGYINYLHLGDTRHLALINIIAEGGTPVIAMLLAGHDNIEMSAHYYSNITSLIECRTYKQYRKVLKGNVTYDLSYKGRLPLNIKDFVLLDDNGRCYSPAFIKDEYSDCQKVCGPNGEIGYCPACTYYRIGTKKDFFKGDDIYRQRIEDDCKHLEQIVRKVRLLKGNSEDILQAMLRLQNSSYTYQQYCEEKLLTTEEATNGTQSKD